MNYSMSRTARARADELIAAAARMIGWRHGVHDASHVATEDIPDATPDIVQWWRSVEQEWTSVFGPVARKPSFSAHNLMTVFNNAALERYGIIAWYLPCTRGYALKNVHFIASYDLSVQQMSEAAVQETAEAMMRGDVVWPSHAWFVTVDDDVCHKLTRMVVARLRELCAPENAKQLDAVDRARRFLSPRSFGGDVSDPCFRTMDFYVQFSMHEDLESAFAADAHREVRGCICLMYAIYRYCVESLCVPLFPDVRARLARETMKRARADKKVDDEPPAAVQRSVVRDGSEASAAVQRSVVRNNSEAAVQRSVVRDGSEASAAPAPLMMVVHHAQPSFVASSSRGRQAIQSWFRGVRYDSITEVKVSVFLQELSRAYGGACVALDIKPGMVEVAAMLKLLRARVGNTVYVPESLEAARWFPDFSLCLNGINYWVEVKYHATRLLITEQEKFHVVGAADRPVLLISVDNGSIQPPYSTGRREYAPAIVGTPATASSGITMTCFRGGRRCDMVFCERADGTLDLNACPEDLRAIRALNWCAPRLLSAYHHANTIERHPCAHPEKESMTRDVLCLQSSVS